MSRIIRSLSSDIVIPFHAWEPRNSSHNGRKSKGITAESLQGGPAVSPHNLLRPLPPSRGEAASSKPAILPLFGRFYPHFTIHSPLRMGGASRSPAHKEKKSPRS